MTYLFAFISAMVISMAIIPLMVRLAPRLGMIDKPDPRKVHTIPIPRAGGVGIVLGALVPIVMWLPLDALSGVYLFGAVVLLIFGVMDDSHELGHYVKFIGQFIAVIPVVYYGDLYITHFPFLNEPISDSIGKPFTVFAMIGMINAINHSDGLDGLAGGMSLLSLSCMAYLAFLANGTSAMLISLAAIGGVFGFLRYNTHPARVFMGDGGSQFLGFTAAFVAVLLIERTNSALSPALPALFLGLPIVDILAVFAQRAYHGMNWFRATKNHIHHRLLELGFDHYESVVIIYSIQALFVVCAIFLAYESDILILSIYLGTCTVLFVLLTIAEKVGWRAHSSHRKSGLTKLISNIKTHELFAKAPLYFLGIAIPALFVFVSLIVSAVPRDFGVASTVLMVTLLLYLAAGAARDSVIVQAVHYVTAAFVVYLETKYLGHSDEFLGTTESAYFVILMVAIGLAIRYGEKSGFKTTPMDYLVVIMVLFASVLLQRMPDKASIGMTAAKLVVVFYGCELVVRRMKSKWNALNIAALMSLAIMSYRGLMP